MTNRLRAPVVALPGLLCDELVWRSQADALRDVTDFVIADFSEHDDLTEMAHAALTLAQGNVHMVGHSMGGRVALEAWRLAPDRIRSLVLLDTGVHGVAPGEVESRQVLVDVSSNSGMSELAAAWLPPMVDPSRHADLALMGSLHDMVMRASPDQHARQIRALVERPDATALLPTITVPTLVVVGRNDEWSPVEQHEQIASLIPNSRLEIIEGAGHMTTVEQPDVITALLRRWFEQH